MMTMLIRYKDQHSPISERGTDVLSRVALGCSVKDGQIPIAFVGWDSWNAADCK
jgi:hypothetical protein